MADEQGGLGSKVIVLKALGGDAKLPYFALLTQGFPRLVTVSRDTLLDRRQRPATNCPTACRRACCSTRMRRSLPDLAQHRAPDRRGAGAGGVDRKRRRLLASPTQRSVTSMPGREVDPAYKSPNRDCNAAIAARPAVSVRRIARAQAQALESRGAQGLAIARRPAAFRADRRARTRPWRAPAIVASVRSPAGSSVSRSDVRARRAPHRPATAARDSSRHARAAALLAGRDDHAAPMRDALLRALGIQLHFGALGQHRHDRGRRRVRSPSAGSGPSSRRARCPAAA